MCTLPITAGKSLVYVPVIHSIFYMVKIVVVGLLYLFIIKNSVILQLSHLFMQKPRVYPFSSSWKVFGIRFGNTQYFFMVKIVVGGLLHLFIYKTRSFTNFAIPF